MTGLTGQSPANTYKDLLHTGNNNAGLDEILRPIYSGNGVASPLSLSATATHCHNLTISGEGNVATYEEGVFTPTLYGTISGGSVSYTTQSGSYIKIGNLLHCTIRLIWTNLTELGNMEVGGLPYNCRSGTENRGTIIYDYFHSLNLAVGDALGGFIQPNTSYARLYLRKQGSMSTAITTTELTTGGELYMTIIYFI